MSQWTLVKTALVWQDKMVVNFGKELANISHDKLRGTRFGAGVRALAVKPDDEKLFLVGTEDGLVHLCTTGFSSTYLRTFPAHHTPVYAVTWNTFQPAVFLSCAAEWTVKMWDLRHDTPLYTFDIQSPAGDVAWAPFSRLESAFISFLCLQLLTISAQHSRR